MVTSHLGSVAQLVERSTENRKVTGSTPVGATTGKHQFFGTGAFLHLPPLASRSSSAFRALVQVDGPGATVRRPPHLRRTNRGIDTQNRNRHPWSPAQPIFAYRYGIWAAPANVRVMLRWAGLWGSCVPGATRTSGLRRRGLRNKSLVLSGKNRAALKHLIIAKPMWHARALACVSACTLLGGSRFWAVKQGLNCIRRPF